MGPGIHLSNADSILSRTLSGLTARQRVIANNVANVDTPGFKGAEVPFERQLQRAMGRTQPVVLLTTSSSHIGGQQARDSTFTPEIVTMSESSLRNDGNNVDIDREMIKLADTSIKYNAVSQLVSERLSLFRSIVNEGRR